MEIDPTALLIAAVLLLYGSVFTLLAIIPVLSVRQSEHSVWYYVGGLSAWMSFFLRHPHTATISAIVVIIIAVTVFAGIQHLPAEADEDTNPPPEISPIYADMMQMPTDYPINRSQLSWPAFFGHPFPLGGDCT